MLMIIKMSVWLCPQEYKLLFEGAGSNPGDKTLEDRFFEHEVTHIITYSSMSMIIS